MFVVGIGYFILSQDRSVMNILSIAVVYGFISFIIFMLLNTRYSDSGWLNETLVSVVYLVVMYRSDLTSLITKSKR